MKHTKFKINKVDSLYQTKPKTTRLQKRVSRGVVLMASTMLHEKCCNLQIGAPRNPILMSEVNASNDSHEAWNKVVKWLSKHGFLRRQLNPEPISMTPLHELNRIS